MWGVGAFRLSALLAALSPFAFAFQDAPESGFAKSLGGPVPGISEREDEAFGRGRRLFRWKLWSPSRDAEAINSTECSECHLDPAFGGTTKDEKLMVPMVPDSSDPSGFRIFQRFSLSPGLRSGKREIPPNAEFRRVPALFGIGLLEAIPESDIKKLADPEDADGDGISGRAAKVEGGMGRFGWKASVSTIERFVILAFRNELGTFVEAFDQPDFSRLGPNQVQSVTLYLRLLGAPAPKTLTAEATRGRSLFSSIGCAACHVPSFVTGDGAVPQLRNKRVEAFTDLLLHDVGPGPAEKTSEGNPNPREFRTAPLWGLGQVGAPFWHDASARTLDAAIQKHEGEAAEMTKRYRALPSKDREAVRAFLNSL